MEFLDGNVKSMPSLPYTAYVEGVQSYECEDCETIIYPVINTFANYLDLISVLGQ